VREALPGSLSRLPGSSAFGRCPTENQEPTKPEKRRLKEKPPKQNGPRQTVEGSLAAPGTFFTWVPPVELRLLAFPRRVAAQGWCICHRTEPEWFWRTAISQECAVHAGMEIPKLGGANGGATEKREVSRSAVATHASVAEGEKIFAMLCEAEECGCRWRLRIAKIGLAIGDPPGGGLTRGTGSRGCTIRRTLRIALDFRRWECYLSANTYFCHE
jgi:hypothetical protein